MKAYRSICLAVYWFEFTGVPIGIEKNAGRIWFSHLLNGRIKPNPASVFFNSYGTPVCIFQTGSKRRSGHDQLLVYR